MMRLLSALVAAAAVLLLASPASAQATDSCGLFLPASCPGIVAATPWDVHVTDATMDGADGTDFRDIDGDGDLDRVTPGEQSQSIVVQLNPGPTQALATSWPSVAVISTLSAPEDAIFADVDADGYWDVVAAGSTPEQMRVAFSPTSTVSATLLNAANWTAITITAATGVQQWMQIAHTKSIDGLADLNGDGRSDIIAGGRVAVPAAVGYLLAPVNRRDAGAWSWVVMDTAGLVMSLFCFPPPHDPDQDGDTDCVISDRSYVDVDGTVPNRDFSKMGARWLRCDGVNCASFSNHTILTDIDATGAANDDGMKMIAVHDMSGDGVPDVLAGRSVTGPTNVLTLSTNNGTWTGWTRSVLATPVNFGQYHAYAVCDLNRDGNNDVVVTADASADGATPRHGVIAFLGPAFTTQIAIAPLGVEKYDNVICHDFDLDGDPDLGLDEQSTTTDLGALVYVNPHFSPGCP